MFTDDKMIPKGSVVTINFRRMRHDKNIFVNPETFDPDRYLSSNILTVPKPALAFFGVGIRACPGMVSNNLQYF